MEDHEIPAGSDLEQIKIVVNSLHLSLRFLLNRIDEKLGADAADAARAELLENMENGNIDMAVLEDGKTFDFVMSVLSALPIRKHNAAHVSHDHSEATH